jgi:long-chain fatty acid transport protein
MSQLTHAYPHPLRALGATLALTLGLAAFAQEAHANGFTFPENGSKAVARGGAYGMNPAGPEALYFNPALLSKLKGYRLTLDLNLVNMNNTFQRAPETKQDGTVVTFDEVSDDPDAQPFLGVFPAPMLFASADFGLEDFTFALGAYGPSAFGTNAYPEDGPQRYMLIRSDLLQIYYSGAAAYQWNGLRVGATFQMAHLMTKIKTVSSSTPAGSGNEDPKDDSIAELDVTDLQPTGILGISYDISPALTVGLSYKLPAKFKMSGPATITFGENAAFLNLKAKEGADATFETDEADVFRLGARYAHLDGAQELFDVELTATYERWSRLERFRFQLPPLEGETPGEIPLDPVVLPKEWEDTFSVRLGGGAQLTPWLRGNLGVFYESGASPTSTTHLDFLAFDRFGGGLGATFLLGDFDVDVAYAYFQGADRTVTDGKVKLIAPLDAAGDKVVNNGDYSSHLHLFSFGFTYHSQP